MTFKEKEYVAVREGLASILTPATDTNAIKRNEDGSEVQQVFYNPIQQFNRDLTVLAIKAYAHDALAAKRSKAKRKAVNNKRKSNRQYNGSAESMATEERPIKAVKLEQGQHAATSPAHGDSMEVDVNKKKDDLILPHKESPEQDKTINRLAAVNSRTEDESNNTPHERLPLEPKFTILDALSATGLRALRYAKELPFVTSVTANDLMPSAVSSIQLNAEFNNLSDRIVASQGDARGHMYTVLSKDLESLARSKSHFKSKRYDVIDLDPYGSAAPFLDAAVQAIREEGGMLCITCTDSAIFAGTGYPEKTYALYGGVPVKGNYGHEAGLRLVLHAVATAAARYGLAIRPLLSLSVDYYLRIFVHIKKSPADVKFLSAKTMVVYSCDQGCGAWTTQPLAKNKVAKNKKGTGFFYKHSFAQAPTASGRECLHCGSRMHLAGPMYAGSLHDNTFVQRIIDSLSSTDAAVYETTDRIEGVLRTALEEHLPDEKKKNEESQKGGDDESDDSSLPLPPGHDMAHVDSNPFYFSPSAVAKVIHAQTPPEDVLRGAFASLGYRVTRSHCKPGSIKTDASWDIIWHVMREWVRQKAPVKQESIGKGTAAWKLLRLNDEDRKKTEGTGTERKEVIFDARLGRESRAQGDKEGKKIVRYQMNPTKNWGPMNKAAGS